MTNLFFKSTYRTPEVNFKTNGELFIGGVSTPDNVVDFFNPIFKWVDDFIIENSNSMVTLDMHFDYLNTSSTRILVELLNKLITYSKSGLSVLFIWKYDEDDEDMKEFGEELELITDSKFKSQAVKVD